MKKLSAKIGMMICDFGLWLLDQGPCDETDKFNKKELIEKWRFFKAKHESFRG
jgi:hypothetical protein